MLKDPNESPRSENSAQVSRRSFVGRGGLLAGGALLGNAPRVLRADEPETSKATEAIPTRVLGKTGVPVTTMTLGTAPAGHSPKISAEQIGRIVNVAIDEGINSIDTATVYGNAQEGVGLGLGSRRNNVFLASKCWADTVDRAEQVMAESLRLTKTDYLDLYYFHSLGHRDMDRAMEPEGVFNWLLKQKKAGKFRFLGISIHNHVDRAIRFLETGEVDVLLTVINFADRYTYNFEEKILPLARKHNVGIVAMKVFGGANKSKGSYRNPDCPSEMDADHLQLAVDYALGVPGVATLNLGVHNIDQVRENVKKVKQFSELSPEDKRQLEDLGKKYAAEWGTHFGPVA